MFALAQLLAAQLRGLKPRSLLAGSNGEGTGVLHGLNGRYTV